VVDAHAFDEPPLGLQLFETRSGDLDSSDHHDVLGDRQEQRSGGGISVALAQNRLDLERRSARLRGIDQSAVVDDSFEDGERADSHEDDRR